MKNGCVKICAPVFPFLTACPSTVPRKDLDPCWALHIPPFPAKRAFYLIYNSKKQRPMSRGIFQFGIAQLHRNLREFTTKHLAVKLFKLLFYLWNRRFHLFFLHFLAQFLYLPVYLSLHLCEFFQFLMILSMLFIFRRRRTDVYSGI